MRDTNNFAPTAKECTALGLRSSKFEFILLRPTTRIHNVGALTKAIDECLKNAMHRSALRKEEHLHSSKAKPDRCAL